MLWEETEPATRVLFVGCWYIPRSLPVSRSSFEKKSTPCTIETKQPPRRPATGNSFRAPEQMGHGISLTVLVVIEI